LHTSDKSQVIKNIYFSMRKNIFIFIRKGKKNTFDKTDLNLARVGIFVK